MILYGNEIFDNYIFPLLDNGDLVLKTSGTTGEPKEVRHNLSEFMKRYLVDRPGYRTLITLDLTRLGGIDALLHVYFYGGVAIIPETRNPWEILELIQKESVELLVTSPSRLNLVMMQNLNEYDLSSLKVIAYGSEKTSDRVLDLLYKSFPNVKIKQTYGLTEIGTVRTHSNRDLIKIVDREWKVEDNLLYLMKDGEWFCTNDIVSQYGDYIKILGRNSNIINVGGMKVQAEEVEAVLEEIVDDALVYGEVNDMVGTIVIADVVSNKSQKEILNYCRSKLDKYKLPMRINIVKSIERNSNGKKVRHGKS